MHLSLLSLVCAQFREIHVCLASRQHFLRCVMGVSSALESISNSSSRWASLRLSAPLWNKESSPSRLLLLPAGSAAGPLATAPPFWAVALSFRSGTASGPSRTWLSLRKASRCCGTPPSSSPTSRCCLSAPTRTRWREQPGLCRTWPPAAGRWELSMS